MDLVSKPYIISDCKTRRGQTTPQMFRQFLGISHYFTLLKKYWPFLHQTWQMNRRPIFNYIYVKNVSKCQICDVTVMTSCFVPLLKFLICIFLQCVRKSTSRGVETWKNFVHITKIKWNMAFLNMKNNSAKYGVLPLRKIPKLEP